MFEFIKNLFKKAPKYQNLGALMLPPEVIAQLPRFEEVVAKAGTVDWSKPLDPNKFNYPVRNQDGSSSCVAATREIIRSIMYFARTGLWVNFSFMWVYTQRTNKPNEGMYAQDVLDVGGVPDELMPSDNKSESQMNGAVLSPWLKDLSKTFLMGTPIVLPIRDIDVIASTIQATGKPIQIFVQFGPGEWSKVPKIFGNNIPYGHSITVLPEFGMYEGEPAILIQDSWGKDLNTIDGKRILKKSFFNKRNCFAQYWLNFKFDGLAVKPHYDGSISSLQDCLTYDGVFPSNVTARGVLGPITVDAIRKFQAKNSIMVTGTVGPITTKKLQELFN